MPLIAGTVLALAALAAGAVVFSQDRSASPADDCGPPEEVYGAAWSADRRQAVLARHKRDVEGMAAVATLDELRAKWLEGYAAACAMPPSAARHERLGCLLEVRDDTNEMTAELDGEDSKLSIGSVVPITIAMGMCGLSDAINSSDRQVPAIPPVPEGERPGDPWSPPGPPGPSGHPRPPRPPRPPVPPHPAPRSSGE
jgi:hypothetical protein